MGEGRPCYHPQNKDSCIAIAFSRHKHLSAWTSSGESEGKTGEHHPTEIPKAHSMSNGLVLEPRLELAEHEVQDKGGDHQGEDAREEVCLSEKDEVADGTHRAEPASLRYETNDQSCAQGEL
jgi:hypothetical protein